MIKLECSHEANQHPETFNKYLPATTLPPCFSFDSNLQHYASHIVGTLETTAELN